jgi:RNA polymerase sigma-70 factor (ECF subfamily)
VDNRFALIPSSPEPARIEDMPTDPNDSSGEQGSQTSLSLLARALDQEEAAWQRLMRLYAPLVARWCQRWGLQAEDSSNVGQEVFAAVARNLGTFDPAGGSFRSWLYTITYHKYADFQRQAARQIRAIGGSDAARALQQVPGTPPTESNDDLDDDKRLLYERALHIIHDEFSQRDWAAFVRVVCDDQSPADVARELGVSVNQVYLAKSRILRKLREEFRDLIERFD